LLSQKSTIQFDLPNSISKQDACKALQYQKSVEEHFSDPISSIVHKQEAYLILSKKIRI